MAEHKDVWTDYDDSYGVDLPGAIHTLLQGYSGGISIVREMTQNADDPPGDDDRWLEFHFNPDALIIRNSTRFHSDPDDPRKDDFKRITRVASGNKAFEHNKTTGAFGVGFVSVYQLTDNPILRSNGREVRFLPEDGKAPTTSSPITDYTEFELPYRRAATKFGDRIGMPVIDDHWIESLLEHELPRELPYLLFFLRRLNRITIFRDNKCFYEVRRTMTSHTLAALAPGQPQSLTITAINRGEETAYCWLRFTGCVQGTPPPRPDGHPAKDGTVHLAIPEYQGNMPEGRLFNYLPTDIKTELPFQINGDFYPSTDRKRIDDGHENHREWNQRVLKALGDCLADALPFLLNHFKDAPLQLYKRLPIRKVDALVDGPIRQRFFEAARPLAIYYTYEGWHTAQKARWVNSKLRPVLSKEVEPCLIPEQLQSAAWEIINVNLKVPEYTLNDFLSLLSKNITPGQPLTSGPSYLCTPEQLKVLYQVFGYDLAQNSREHIATTPVFLDHKGLLWRANECVQATNEEIQDVLKDSGLHFPDDMVMSFSAVVALVEPFTLPHLWRVLGQQLPDKRSLPLKNAPDWMNTRRSLYRLYRAIASMRENINKADVQHLPLCLDRFERLHPPGSLFLPEKEPVLYTLLEGDQKAPLVDQAMYNNKEYNLLYENLGVAPFGWERLVDRIAQVAYPETPLAHQTHPCLQSRERLLQLYRYLNSKRGDIEQQGAYGQKLRQDIPIWLCRDGVLRTAKNLSLPANEGDWPSCIAVHNVVAVETKEGLDSFFKEILHLKPLTHARFIADFLLKQYAGLTSEEQMEALRYLRDDIPQQELRHDNQLLRTVQQTPLLYGDDEQCYCASDLCLPDDNLRQLFPNHLRFLHQARYIGSDPLPKNLYEWHWYTLFSMLRIGRHAPPDVVLREITDRSKRPASDQESREVVEKIFRYLEENWSFYAELGGKLQSLQWLPADDDTTRWYAPTELYPRQEKPLVDQVAKVIGFREARSAKEAIAAALKFPSAWNNTQLVVQQLLKLSERNLPASKEIYRLLGRDSVKAETVQGLLGQAVFYDDTAKRYWKADQVLHTKHRASFGPYRGYLLELESEYRPLLTKLQATDQPFPRDYVDLIRDISERYHDDVPAEERILLQNAYSKLKPQAESNDNVLAALKATRSVLSKAGDEPYRMRRPDAVLLQPPQRYLEYLPDLPIAHYTSEGVTTLEAIGVRSLEDVLQEGFEIKPDTSHRFDLSAYFKRLEHPLKRVLYHDDQLERAQAVWQRITNLKAFEQKAIRVVYQVTLADKPYRSGLLTQAMFYEAKSDRIYLEKGLKGDNLHWELAQIVYQIIGIENSPLLTLLKEIIAHPKDAEKTLDRSKIKSLPDDTRPVAQPPERVELSGPNTGLPGEQCSFRATIEPPTATPPFTYEWQIDGKRIRTSTDKNDTIDQYQTTWPEPGTYELRVIVQGNTGDAVEASHTMTIRPKAEKQSVAPTSITIDGEPDGTVGKTYRFKATVAPHETTPPLTWEWCVNGKPHPTTGPFLDHTWEHPGTARITATVSNAAGTATGEHRMKIEPPPPPTPPESVTIHGNHEGFPNKQYSFTATVEPREASPPLRYTWRVDGHEINEHSSEKLPYHWTSPGAKEITVTVSNAGGSVGGKHSITIYPPFQGVTEYKSPAIPTNWYGLRQRVSHWAEQNKKRLESLPAPPPPRSNTPASLPQPLGDNTARFTLSFPEVEYGFLRLSKKARALFNANTMQVTCVTDFSHRFALYLDGQQGLAYSQPALRDFFANQGIPPGGIVYLEKRASGDYRLFYHSQPARTVRQVRLASPAMEQGQATVTYDIVGEQEVHCEIDEAVYRAEQRFGDWAALLIESIGKKAVVETLCDLFMDSSDIWLHGDDLDAFAERMVAASTVPQTLGRYPFFVLSGEYWRLDPQQLIEYANGKVSVTGADLVERWCKATNKLLEEPSLLTDARIIPPFNNLRQALRAPTASPEHDSDSLIGQLNREPENDYLQQQVRQTIEERLASAENIATDAKLQEIVQGAGSEAWEYVLRPALQNGITAFQKGNEYLKAAQVAELWGRYDDECPVDLDETRNEAEAWQLINVPVPTVEAVLEAIRIAPKLTQAYKKLHAAVQTDLQSRSATNWLQQATGNSTQAVEAFYQHVAAIQDAARSYLQREHQQALDTTIKERANELWKALGEKESEGKLSLLLRLRTVAPTAKLDNEHFQYLVRFAIVLQEPLYTLLLARTLWKLLPEQDTYLRPQVAAILADCHIGLKIWELANNQPWRKVLDGKKSAALRQGCSENNTHLKREQDFLHTLQQGDPTFLGTLLAEERLALQREVERDIRGLTGSAA